jgi:hypothetical protein
MRITKAMIEAPMRAERDFCLRGTARYVSASADQMYVVLAAALAAAEPQGAGQVSPLTWKKSPPCPFPGAKSRSAEAPRRWRDDAGACRQLQRRKIDH